MTGGVLRLRWKDSQVRWVIVLFIVIDVMHDFTLPQFPAQARFSNNPMLVLSPWTFRVIVPL